ncbi:MAG: chemotaxis response regulator protein-glutamate methylesterase [Ruminiclostridium sp.]
MSDKIKVLVVDDSFLFRSYMMKELSVFDDIEVVGLAMDAEEARVKITELKPDVVTLDIEMPGMNGIDFLKTYLNEYRLPFIVITSKPEYAFDAMSAGAIDFVNKSSMRTSDDGKSFIRKLVNRIRVAKSAKIRTLSEKSGLNPVVSRPVGISENNSGRIIALGASTGGTEALIEVVKRLPANSPPVVIVQHMPANFTKMYAARMNSCCPMNVKEAEDGDRLVNGQAIIAAGEFHLTLEKDARGYYVKSRRGEKVSGHCPSVDVLFESVARTAGKDAIGAILTGMGSDGAEGLLKMRNAGAYTIGQDEESCVVYGMPGVAYKIGAVMKQLPLNGIAEEILSKV